MRFKMALTIAVALATCATMSADGKKKNQSERGMLEKMEAVPCGAQERGLTGLGSVWASAGITHVNSDEKLCPEYLLRTDQMEYHIRPTDGKHPTVLPIGHEGEFKIKNDRMFLKVDDGDKKTRTYRVVSENPTDADSASANSKKQQADKP
jgi:hypothetical protein